MAFSQKFLKIGHGTNKCYYGLFFKSEPYLLEGFGLVRGERFNILPGAFVYYWSAKGAERQLPGRPRRAWQKAGMC
jgi:hypothetical protein